MPHRPTFFDSTTRARILERLRSLEPNSERRWGRMTAPEMVAHLTDQMSHTLGLVSVEPVTGPMRLPLVKYLSIYWVPWPKGKVHGPPEAFATKPGSWDEDLERLAGLVEAFGGGKPDDEWPDHALFGPMSGPDWGCFCHKHFDHHLRQFGV